jgi:glycosyltransferase 2 family protein
MTAGIWGLYMLMTFVAFRAFGLEDRLGWGAAWVTLAISSIGVAIPTPGSTGTYHAFASQTLTQLFGVDATTALSFATATHAIGFVGVTLIGLWFFVKDHLSFSEAVRGGPEKEG